MQEDLRKDITQKVKEAQEAVDLKDEKKPAEPGRGRGRGRGRGKARGRKAAEAQEPVSPEDDGPPDPEACVKLDIIFYKIMSSGNGRRRK